MGKIINKLKENLDWNSLVSILDYNLDTGIFINKVTRSNHAKINEIAGNTDNTDPDKYSDIYINGYHYLAHRLAWFYVFKKWPTEYIDHIDGNKSNNSIYNLRQCTDSQNKYNTKIRKDNLTGFKGVSLDKRSGKYRAYITINKKQKSLGYYTTAEEASKAYNLAAKELHGIYYNETTICS